MTVRGADFFQRQQRTRRASSRLLFAFALACAVTVLAVYLLLRVLQLTRGGDDVVLADWSRLWEPATFAATAVAALGLILAGALHKYRQLRKGGPAVAALLQARPLREMADEPAARRLENVVEEMAIAANLPRPEVYVLVQEQGLNALAAGSMTEQAQDAAIIVTAGCMRELGRDELQAVIGHEFSHFLNQDMRLGTRLTSLTWGLTFLAGTGRHLLPSIRRGPHVRRDARGSAPRRGTGGWLFLPLLPFALLFLAVGAAGALAGGLLRASFSRERQHLADASAVQFTRNPAGLQGALQRCSASEEGAVVRHPKAAQLAHLFFAEPVRRVFFPALFATHPSIDARLRALAVAEEPQPPAPATEPRSMGAGFRKPPESN